MWHFLLWVSGTSTTGGAITWWYNFWSGFGSDLGLFAGVGAFLVHKNCHVSGCWRLGGHHGTCKVHRGAPVVVAGTINKLAMTS